MGYGENPFDMELKMLINLGTHYQSQHSNIPPSHYSKCKANAISLTILFNFGKL
jgi:hypothetical protein